MKRVLFIATVLTASFAISCQNEENIAKGDVSKETLDKISALGFSRENVVRVNGAYLVEGDILLYDRDLNSGFAGGKNLMIASEEQYRTTNLVTGTPRVITISVSSKLPSSYIAAVDEAINRYNAENLSLTFRRVSSGATIAFTKAPANAPYLASAGFPTSTGNPHNQIQVNVGAIGNQPLGTVASIFAHEIGHCIGFRHTDYMDRTYSGCSPVGANEGQSTVGAIHIPGTPTGPDAGSWMLACIGAGMDRPFNANDKAALDYLY